MPNRPGEPAPTPARWVECVTLFVIAPGVCAALFARSIPPFDSPRWLFPALWLWGIACLTLLLTDRSFDRRDLWRWSGLTWTALRPVLLRFLWIAPLLTAFVALAYPDRLFEFPRERLRIWVFVMIGYPIASVYAQEVIFRPFFAHRYRALFPATIPMLAANAFVFGWVHIVFLNPLAVVLTLPAGVLFLSTYLRTRSTATACVEHALYGCFTFTVGLGRFFYSGAVNPG